MVMRRQSYQQVKQSLGETLSEAELRSVSCQIDYKFVPSLLTRPGLIFVPRSYHSSTKFYQHKMVHSGDERKYKCHFCETRYTFHF